MKRIKLLLSIAISIALFSACNKDEDLTFDPSAKLNFSTDSILFDTVFTSIGSTVRRLKIFNYNKKAINIEQLKIAGGASSPFVLNVNGKQTLVGENIKINGMDSINVLVKVNINPTLQSQAFIVEDSVLLSFNGRKDKIPLVAYGQNANFINNGTISSNTIWNSNLPYIVYSSVTVAENTTLTIAAGAQVLFHNGANMNVKGTLLAIGTKQDSILFASDRTERIYEEESGQWNGIHFYSNSKNSIINHATIKNGITGITLDSLSTNTNPKLILANSIVKNMQVVGFLGYHTDLAAFNNLFYNCGQYLIYGIGGGKYNLLQNTFGAFNFNFSRRTPAIFLSDFISTAVNAPLNATLTNNIIWGSLDDELTIEKKSDQISAIDISYNLIKSKDAAFNGNNNLLNADPLFINTRQGNFKLGIASPAKAKGKNVNTSSYFATYLLKDILETTRTFPSTLGCYESH